MRDHVELQDGKVGIIFADIPVRPEVGQVHLQRWGLKGARAASTIRMLVDDQEVVYMDLIPREVIIDGMQSVYQEDEQRYTVCVIGGLVTRSEDRGKGYATALLMKLVELLQEHEPRFSCICNFVLEERLSFFLERGWQQVDRTSVRVTIQQPQTMAILLPERFNLMLLPLQDSFVAPEETFEYMGLPA